MKKKLAIILAACLMFGITACGSQKDGGNKQSDKPEQAEQKEEVKYEGFSKFGLTYELPEGTTEQSNDDGDMYYYYNGDLYIAISWDLLALNDSNIENFADGGVENFAGGKRGDISKITVDGHEGYQFDIQGKLNDTEMVVTQTAFCIEGITYIVMSSAQNTNKEDYEEVNKHLIASIQADEESIKAALENVTPDYYVDGHTAVTEGCTIKITDYKVLKPGEGTNAYGSDPIIVFNFDITNTSETEITPAVEWPSIISVVQDNDPNAVNSLTPAITIGDDTAKKMMDKVKAGGTVQCGQAYTLSDTTTPVTLTVRNGIAGEELGTMTFELK